jgi:hypothetical protein
MTRTDRPTEDNEYASAHPAMPAPMMMTSGLEEEDASCPVKENGHQRDFPTCETRQNSRWRYQSATRLRSRGYGPIPCRMRPSKTPLSRV